MPLWAKYSTRWYLDPRVLSLSVDAELVYARAIAYCKEEMTDGAVARGALIHLGAKLDDPDGCAQELLEVGLWERDGRGFTFPSATWARWQGTRADVEQFRADGAERQRKSRRSRRDSSVTNGKVTLDNGVSNGEVTQLEPELEPEISLSVPTRVQEGTGPGSAERETNDHDLDRTVAELGDRMRLPEEDLE
jgi:hypothetical protein